MAFRRLAPRPLQHAGGSESDLVIASRGNPGVRALNRSHRSFERSLVYCLIENTIAVLIMNIVLGRQLRAARILAGLTQRRLSTEAGFNPRACRYWERRGNKLPPHIAATLATIEQVVRRHGVEVFSIPTPGARLI